MARTVLIADPDIATLELATTVLTRIGFRVESTNDGGDALARFFESSPCAVICDAGLPGVDGAQLCRHIREQSKETRLILLHGGDDPSNPETIGCDALLERPFRFDPIRSLLAEWGLLEEQEPDAEVMAFGVPPAPALSGNEPEPEVELPTDAIEETIPAPPTGARVVVKEVLVVRRREEAGEAAEPPEPPEAVEAPEPPEAIEPGTVEAPEPGTVEAPEPSVAIEAVGVPAPPEAVAVPAALEPATPPRAEVPAPQAPDLAPIGPPATAEQPALAPTAHDDGPLPIPVPVPTADEDEGGLVLDRERVVAASSDRPTEGKGLPPSLPRVGTLMEMPLPRLLFELYAGTYSGKLNLYRKGQKRSVFLWAGLPVFVQSDQLEERLGVLLRDEGRITEEQYDHGVEASLSRGVRMGEALIELGYISGSDLLEALEAQTEKKLINTLGWRDGSYKLVDDTSFVEGEVLTDVHPLKVIWRGVHEHYDLMSMMSFFSKLGSRYIVTTDLFPVQFEALGPHLRDLAAASLLDGKTTFMDALQSDDTRALEIAQALYVLMVTDMVRPSTEPGEPAPVVERRKSETAETAPVDYRFLMEITDRIAKEFLRIKGKDHYTVLDVARDAGAAAIDEAYRDAIEVTRKDLKRPGLPHDSLKRSREIADILAQAHVTLSDENERRAYDAGLDEISEADTRASDLEKSRQKKLFAAEQAYREGIRLLEMLDARGARKQFEQALLGNPAEPTYRVSIAQAILVEHKNDPGRAHTEAFIYLEDALRIDPGNIPANLEAAQLFADQQMNDKARAHLERVLQRAPHHQKARRLLDSLS